MKRKEKAAPDDCSIESGAGEQIRRPAINLPGEEYSTQPVQGRIESLLLHGEENAIQAKSLAAIAGVQTSRELRQMVERERRNGALILSSVRGRGGYYLPAEGAAGADELQTFTRTTTARIVALSKMIRPFKRALRERSAAEGWQTEKE